VHPIAEIRTTFPDREAAEACARRLVAARLAACVQIDGPVASVYHWQEQVEQSAEWRCTCKTTTAGLSACVAAILSAHPYELPEVLVAAVEATADYAAWVRAAVAPLPGKGDGDGAGGNA